MNKKNFIVQLQREKMKLSKIRCIKTADRVSNRRCIKNMEIRRCTLIKSNLNQAFYIKRLKFQCKLFQIQYTILPADGSTGKLRAVNHFDCQVVLLHHFDFSDTSLL